MTEIRPGEGLWSHPPPEEVFQGTVDAVRAAPDDERVICVFCLDPLFRGAHWSASLFVCSRCVLDGKLGLLIGDALDCADQIERALVATEREAWRAPLARERREYSG